MMMIIKMMTMVLMMMMMMMMMLMMMIRGTPITDGPQCNRMRAGCIHIFLEKTRRGHELTLNKVLHLFMVNYR